MFPSKKIGNFNICLSFMNCHLGYLSKKEGLRRSLSREVFTSVKFVLVFI